MAKLQRISPCLGFEDEALEAAKFYTKIFKNSKIGAITKYDAATAQATGQPKGSVLAVSFTLDGQEFLGINGGPSGFSDATSFMILCENQKEIDHFWDKLTDGGQEVQCGWLKDKYGVAWQIVPIQIYEVLKNPKRFAKWMGALMQMKKLDVAKLMKAANS